MDTAKKHEVWRDYPPIEVRFGGWGATGLRRFEPSIRVLRLSLYFYSLTSLLWWYPIARWTFWCLAFPHIWVNYGCPTCVTFCARRCGARKAEPST